MGESGGNEEGAGAQEIRGGRGKNLKLKLSFPDENFHYNSPAGRI